jgi:hypothetical protein
MLTAGYLLWTIQRVFLGPPTESISSFRRSGPSVHAGAVGSDRDHRQGLSASCSISCGLLDQINQIVLPHLHN